MAQGSLRLAGLTKRFGGFVAVDGVSFSVGPGEIVAFLGPNGAGKTTTLRMAMGLLRPTAGRAEICGCDVVQHPLAAKRRAGYVPDGAPLYPKLTGREFIDFVAGIYRLDRRHAAGRAAELLALFDLSDKADDMIEGYSHGMRQKVAICAALIHEPDVLFLDEPTSGLDPRSARTVKDLLTGLAARGCAVIFSTHVLEIAEHMCHRAAIIDRGRLVALGSMDDLRVQAGAAGGTLEDVFLQLTGGPEAREIATFLGGG